MADDSENIPRLLIQFREREGYVFLQLKIEKTKIIQLTPENMNDAFCRSSRYSSGCKLRKRSVGIQRRAARMKSTRFVPMAHFALCNYYADWSFVYQFVFSHPHLTHTHTHTDTASSSTLTFVKWRDYQPNVGLTLLTSWTIRSRLYPRQF